MSISELFQVPPIQGTNLSVESIQLAGSGGLSPSPITTFTQFDLQGQFYIDDPNVKLGPTGFISGTILNNNMMLILPGQTGTTGGTGTSIFFNAVMPTQYRPSVDVEGPCLLASDGFAVTSPGAAVLILGSSTGIITIKPTNGTSNTISGTTGIPVQNVLLPFV